MSNSPAATLARRSVDGAFIRLWGIQYITYTLDVVYVSLSIAEEKTLIDLGPLVYGRLQWCHTSSFNRSWEAILKPCQIIVMQYFRKYSKKDPLLIRTTVSENIN